MNYSILPYQKRGESTSPLSYPSLKTIPLRGQKVLVRTDLNVPLAEGKVADTLRLKRALETIHFLSQQGAQVIVLSHLGRPKGKVDPLFSLKPVVEALQRLAPGLQFVFCPFFQGEKAAPFIEQAGRDKTIVLENLRFAPEEEANDSVFVQKLAQLGDFYINDAFSASHRAHGSIVGLPLYLPCTAGFLFDEEVQALQRALTFPTRPLMAIVAGSKISTKLCLLKNLLTKVDILAIGGAMAHTFLKAQGGIPLGASLREDDFLETAKEIMAEAALTHKHLLLPVDGIVAEEGAPSHSINIRTVRLDPSEPYPLQPFECIFDVGPKTIEIWASFIKRAKTLVWNGPLGAFETPPFHISTQQLAHMVVARTTQHKLQSIAGGGDTLAAFQKSGNILKHLTYASSSGGAFLEWLEGKALPGLEALVKANTLVGL